MQIAAIMRTLVIAMRSVTGALRPHYIGYCPNVLDFAPDLGYRPAFDEDPGVPVVCGQRLYAPTTGDTIRCTNPDGGRKRLRPEWLQLGHDLQALLASGAA